MKISFINSFSIIILLLLNSLIQCEYDVKNKKSRGKCILMISDSSAFNFHYLKSLKNENK